MDDRSPEGSGIHAPALAPGHVLSPDAAKQVDAFVREAERAMPPWLHAELAKAARSGNTSALVGARYDAATRRWSRDDPSPAEVKDRIHQGLGRRMTSAEEAEVVALQHHTSSRQEEDHGRPKP